MKRNLPTFFYAWLLLGAAGIMTAHAQNTLLTFSVDMATNLADGSFNPPPPAGTGTDTIDVRGAFNSWAPLLLVQQGTSTVFTNSYVDTAPANGATFDYKFYLNGNGETTACYDNRTAFLPSTNNGSLVLPTHYYSDIGPGVTINVTFRVDMSQEIELGHFHPQNGDTLVAVGSFDGWSTTPGAQFTLTNDPTILITNNNFSPPVVESNVYIVTAPITQCSAYSGLPATNASQDFKYVEMPAGFYENSIPATSNDNGNRWLVETGDQTLPLVSFSDLPYTPLAMATFNVDMSGVIKSDPNYVPNSVVVWGTFNNWATGIPMTNNPVASNTNIFSTVITTGEGAAVLYQVRYTNSAINDFVYDYLNDEVYNNDARRTITFPITSTLLVTNVPSFYFNDLADNDYLPTATAVLFTVDMNGAVGTDMHVFDPNSDGVYINGSFVNEGYPQAWYAWSGGANPVTAPAGYQMMREGMTTLYTNTIIMPAGTPVPLSYQYGMDPYNANGGPLQDEASGINHFRVVRSTVSNPYVMPVDTFTNMPYQEPFFSKANIWGVGNLAGGQLTVGAPVAGKVPVSWLGQPGAQLQANTSLTGPWQSLPATDGTNWTAGYSSTNGFVSVTNWPAGGSTFFRLVRP